MSKAVNSLEAVETVRSVWLDQIQAELHAGKPTSAGGVRRSGACGRGSSLSEAPDGLLKEYSKMCSLPAVICQSLAACRTLHGELIFLSLRCTHATLKFLAASLLSAS